MISKRSDTAVVLALDTLLNDEVTPLYNDEIIKEYNDVLHREKFHLPEALVNSVIDHIQTAGIPSNRVHSNEVFPDADDVVFYEVALSQEDSFLVTGNTKHFPKDTHCCYTFGIPEKNWKDLGGWDLIMTSSVRTLRRSSSLS